MMRVFAHNWVQYFAEYLSRYLSAELRPFNDRTPTDRGLIFGCFASDERGLRWLASRARLTQRCIAMFVGWDIKQLQENWPRHKTAYEVFFNHVRLATDGGADTKALLEAITSRPVACIPLPPPRMYSCRPFLEGPLEFGCRQSPQLHGKYKLPLILEVARRLPDVTFHVHHPFGFPAEAVPAGSPGNVEYHEKPIEDMDGFLTRIAGSIRMTDTDTTSMGSIESMMAGRYVITNRRIPLTLHCPPSVEAILRKIAFVGRRVKDHPLGRMIASDYYTNLHSPQRFIEAMDSLWAQPLKA